MQKVGQCTMKSHRVLQSIGWTSSGLLSEAFTKCGNSLGSLAKEQNWEL